MEIDSSEKYLATGDVNGIVKIWDINNVGLNVNPLSPVQTDERQSFHLLKLYS